MKPINAMEMVRHQQKQFDLPPLRVVIAPGCLKNLTSALRHAKLISATFRAANGYEIGRTKSTSIVNGMMIELFPNCSGFR